jgi:hypothetical protein
MEKSRQKKASPKKFTSRSFSHSSNKKGGKKEKLFAYPTKSERERINQSKKCKGKLNEIKFQGSVWGWKIEIK